VPIDGIEVGSNALVTMGFRHAEARRAIDEVMSRHDGGAARGASLESILREALAVLTLDAQTAERGRGVTERERPSRDTTGSPRA
jgi:hypothetical protein